MEPPSPARPGAVFASWLGLALAAGAAVVLLWFLSKVVLAILMLFFAIVIAIALSAPVGWFMRRGCQRHWAAILTLLLFFATIALLGALVIPRLAGQIVLLVRELPEFVARFQGQLAAAARRAIRTCSPSSASSAAPCRGAERDRDFPRPQRLLAVAARDPGADPDLLHHRRLHRARSPADHPGLLWQPAAASTGGRGCAPIAAPAGR